MLVLGDGFCGNVKGYRCGIDALVTVIGEDSMLIWFVDEIETRTLRAVKSCACWSMAW